MIELKNKRVTVLGLGESGIESALFLRDQGARVFVSEFKVSPRTQEAKNQLDKEGIECEIGRHTMSEILNSQLVVVSPGIAPSTDVYSKVLQSGISMISEIELASLFFKGDIVAITGTNGKTTVTTLIAHVLNACGRAARSCGNIGNSFIGEISSMKSSEIAVVELSSFQLKNTFNLKPKVAVLLNMEPDHLDWHPTLEDYYESKMRLFQKQDSSDFAVLNFEDPEIRKREHVIQSKKIYFNQFKSEFDPNLQAVIAVAEIYKLPAAQVKKALESRPVLEHRLEPVPTQDGLVYLNDSKSTNVSSLKWALHQMKKKVILICGGKNKGADFSELVPYYKEKVKEAILIGEAQGEMERVFRNTVPVQKAQSLRDAVLKARGTSQAGDIILLSPACASFDMFFNYIDRGNQFRQIVKEVAALDLKMQKATSTYTT